MWLRGRDEAIIDRLVADMGDRIIPDHHPRHSSPSNPAEAAVQQVEGQTRVLKLDLEKRYGARVTSVQALRIWLLTR